MDLRAHSDSETLDQLLENQNELRSRRNMHTGRPIYSQNLFDKSQELGEHGTPSTPSQKLRRWTFYSFSKIRSWHPNIHPLHFVLRMFPIVEWLRTYKLKEYLPKDLIAGLTVGIMTIPQGMAYALLAQVPAIFGLYSNFYPPIIYTLMCTSHHVAFGTFAITSIMTGKIVSSYVPHTLNSTGNFSLIESHAGDDLEDENLEARIGVLVAVTVAVGMWQLLMGILGLGYLSVYLSDQLVKGFTTGAAFHVFTSQLKALFGLRNLKEYSGPLKLFYTYIDFFKAIHLTNIPTLIISLICIISLILVKFLFNSNSFVQSKLPLKFPIPGELLVVVFGALTSYLMDLRGSVYNVSVVGNIPRRLPAPIVPNASLFPKFVVDCFGIAIVSFAITMSLAKLFANKYGYHVQANQELRAMGFSNLISGFFKCIPATGSLTRAALQSAMGGVTQMVSLVSSLIVLIVILALGFLLEPLPKACLASIIVVALSGMLSQVTELIKLWKISAVDTILQMPGCKIIRFESPLYFANADYFLDQMRHISGISHLQHLEKKRTKVKVKESAIQAETNSSSESRDLGHDNLAMSTLDFHGINAVTEMQFVASSLETGTSTVTLPNSTPVPIKHVILDCSSMSFIDVNAVKVIKEFANECHEFGVTLFLACCKANVREIFALSGHTSQLPIDNFFVTIHDAVMQALKSHENEDLHDRLRELQNDVYVFT